MREILAELGLNIGLMISGLFGSLLTIKDGSAQNLTATFVSLATGVGSANYITPIVVDLLNLEGSNISFGIAFLLGYLGLSGVDYVLKRIFPSAEKKS